MTPRSSIERMRSRVWLGIGVIAGVFSIIFVVTPGWRETLLVEDGPLESTTAVAYVVAIAVGVWAMRHNSAAQRLYWVVPGFALYAFLDELSFGSRIFGFGLPEVDGMTVDSVHDVFDLTDRALGNIGIGRTMAAGTVLLAAGGVLAWIIATRRWPRLLAWFRARPPITNLVGAIALLVVAVAMDLLGGSASARFVEEILEFVASGMVVLAGVEASASPAPARVGAP